jgi:hypothetical protein|tara:strand:+ start:131 stop:1402 length:1272 start_codon:yes stop_codon:yes gene_type:complete
MVSIIDNFNQVSLHNPSEEILKLYSHIDEIYEVDPRGYNITRPLFSHSDMPNFLNTPTINIKDFGWDKPFVYSVVLHHNNALAAKHLNLIPKKILEQIKEKKCKLVLDNTMEGDEVTRFFKAIYNSIEELKLPASQIYYVTNSLVAENEHKSWISEKNIYNTINVISFMYNVMDVQRLKNLNHLPQHVDIEEEIYYKEQNIDKIKPFLKVNRTGRPERNLFMLHLNKYDLFDKFLISFPEYPDYNFPSNMFHNITQEDNIESLKLKCPFDIDQTDIDNHGPPGAGIGKFNADLPFDPTHYRNSMLSFVMCAFPFVEGCCHLHSSTFNPIYCGHPVIQFGPHNHLEVLKSLGFKTFSKWWDESYDKEGEGWVRFQGVLNNLNTLRKLSKTQILNMYKDMKNVLQHNSDLIQNYNIKKVLIDRIL